MTLLELAARVEALTGPCVQTNCAIYQVLNPHMVPIPGNENTARFYDPAKTRAHIAARYFMSGNATGVARRYTGSLDAAMTLVPEGCGWRIWAPSSDSDQRHRSTIWAARGMPIFAPFDVEAATPALALTAAALRARAAMVAL